MMNLNEKQEKSLDAFRSFVENSEYFTRQDILNFTDETKTHKKLGVIRPWFLCNISEKVDRGEWKFPEINGTSSSPVVAEDTTVSLATHASAARTETAEMVTNVIEFPMNSESYVPSKVNGYVKFGHYADVKTIKKSGNFYPISVSYTHLTLPTNREV